MSITTVIDAIASIQRNITGVENAYGLSEIPSSLSSTMCPACITIPGEAAFEFYDADMMRSTRTYIMELYITPAASPLAFAKKITLAEPFPARFAAAFLARRTLEGLGWIEDAQYLRDGGVTTLSYLGSEASFVAIQCFIEVTELARITNVDY